MNRHQNSEGQECKPGLIKGKALMGGGGQMKKVKKVNMIDALSIQV
jgi:hypothetical protein